MAKFTKLNIGDSVASSGGRVWKKLSSMLQLSAPTLSLDGNTLTITDDSGLATSFDILVDGVVKATATSATFDLSTLDLEEGTYSISVIAKADGYKDSVESEAVIYEVADELVGTWKVSSSYSMSFNSINVGNLVYADSDNYEPIGTFQAANGSVNNLICAYNLNGMQHSAICRLSGSKNHLTFCRPYGETSSVSQFDASYIRNATITFNENIANIYVDDTFRAWLKANATKTA